MIFEKVTGFTKRLEDPTNPSLGPTLKALYLFGLWQTGSKFRTMMFNLLHILSLLFVFSQFAELYIMKHDVNKVFDNMSLTVLSVICLAKTYSVIFSQKRWINLVQNIAEEEIFQSKKQDVLVKMHINCYIKYTRIITYMYWLLVFATNLLLICTPFLKYLSSKSYREEIKRGIEPLPQILRSWFPFDNKKMPGYLLGIIFHVTMGNQGSGIIASYDMNAIAIMSYFKGQMLILEQKCIKIFEEADSTKVILDRIKECHRHHTSLLKHYKMFNSLLSPTMFLYVLLCSITICGSIVQFTSKQASTSQKMWVVEYTAGLVTQLFLYCWHSNELTLQSFKLSRGIHNSDWWQSDVRVRKQLLLLAGKLNHPFILDAGPYTTLSVPALVSIMKRSYSFYTLFSKIQDEKNA